MKTINKTKLIHLIYKRLNGVISKMIIGDIIIIVVDKLIDDLLNDKVFSICNFGTFTVRENKGYYSSHIITGAECFIKPKKFIFFTAHHIFLDKIMQRRDKFEKG